MNIFRVLLCMTKLIVFFLLLYFTDNIVHYFLILIRNHAQIITTQMLSTHDPMMRGSLDFPNLIKIHGISGSFKLVMEIYSMVRNCLIDHSTKVTCMKYR